MSRVPSFFYRVMMNLMENIDCKIAVPISYNLDIGFKGGILSQLLDLMDVLF